MNPYDILNVSQDADFKTIKAAYRSLAQIWHPDKETGDEDKFNEIKQAYEILKDEDRRKLFDETGSTDERMLNPAKIVIDTIRILFDKVLVEVNYGKYDYVKLIIEKIELGEENVSNELAKTEEKLKKLKAIKASIKKEGKDNVFTESINAKIFEAENLIKELEFNNQIAQLCKDLLENYEFEEILGLQGNFDETRPTNMLFTNWPPSSFKP